MSSAEPNNLNVSPSIIPSSPSPLPPENCSDPRDVSGNGFNRFDPKYISIGPKATRNPLGSAQSNVNKCATLRHGGRYGNSASKFSSLKGGPQVPVVIGYKNPQPPSVSTVCNEFGSFGSATLDRRTTSTFGGGGGGGTLNNINESGGDKAMFTIEGSSSTFGRPIGNNQNKIYMESKQSVNPGMSVNVPSAAPSPKPISILNQPLPEIPHSALKIDAPPQMVTANTNQPLSAANLNHYQISNGPKSSFSMTSQLLQSGGGGGPLNSINGNPVGAGNYPLKSSMKQQPSSSLSNPQNPAMNVRPSIQQAPLPPPPVQQPKPQMFSSINSTKTLPPQLPPKNRHKEPSMMTSQNQMHQQQQRQTLPNSKSQSQMTQFNKSNPQYATFMGYSENNNNKVVDSGDKARLIQQYYQETSNMRNNNNNGMADYGTNTKMGSQMTGNRMSYQTLPHQPAKFSQQQQQAMMAHQKQQQQYSQFAGGMQHQHHQPQQQLQPHPNYNTSGKITSGHNTSVGTQVRHGGGGGSKVDRNSNIEQMTYYRSLQRGAAREAGSANNDLYSDNLMYRHRK